MAKRDTRAEIAAAFKASVCATSLSQTRIADLIAQLGINRNTFYYHFANKYEVALWIFRSHLAARLRHDFPESQLVSAPFSATGAGKEPLPYYVHKETGARTLDAGGFYKALATTALEDPVFYRKLFTPREYEFIQHVAETFEPAMRADIDFILDGRYMPEETKALLADTCAHQAISLIEFFLANQSRADALMDERTNPFWNVIQESLYNAIQDHPMNRF